MKAYVGICHAGVCALAAGKALIVIAKLTIIMIDNRIAKVLVEILFGI
jgi:hypothetical protein